MKNLKLTSDEMDTLLISLITRARVLGDNIKHYEYCLTLDMGEDSRITTMADIEEYKSKMERAELLYKKLIRSEE